MNGGLIRNGENLYEIVRSISSHMVEDKDRVVDKELLGQWVKYNDCDHVLLQNGKYLLCRTIEEAEIVDSEKQLETK